MRNSFFDVLKGYAIILVVLGHVIQIFMPGYESNRVYLIIYSFHMPLFMAISGYFFLRSVDKSDTANFIKNKFYHLMVPSLTMGSINCCVILGWKLLKHSDLYIPYFLHLQLTGLWFLTVLFILSVVGCILRKHLKDKMYYGWTIVLIGLYFCPQIWVSHELKYLAPFFVGAMALSKYNWARFPYWLLIVSTIGFSIMLLYFDFSKSMYRMDNAVLSLSHSNDYLFRFSIGLFGCLTSILLCRIITQINILLKMLTVIGTMTLPIYALHQKIIEWNNFIHYDIISYPLIIIVTLFVTITSIILYRILKTKSLLAFFLFGEYNY